MTRPGIEPRSPGPLANTLPTSQCTWNHTISYKLLVLDKNACNHITESKKWLLLNKCYFKLNHLGILETIWPCKLLVLDRNTWNNMTMQVIGVR